MFYRHLATVNILTVFAIGAIVAVAVPALFWPIGTATILAAMSVHAVASWSERRRSAAATAAITRQAQIRDQLQIATQRACSLDPHPATLLPKLSRLAVDGFADWCSIVTVDTHGTLRRAAIASADPGKAHIATALLHLTLPPDAAMSYPRVIRTGKTEFAPEVPAAFIEAVTVDPHYHTLLNQIDIRSMITVPLTIAGKTFGAVTFIRSSEKPIFDLEDKRAAEDWGNQVTRQLDHAALAQRAVRQMNELKAVRQIAAALLRQPQFDAIVTEVVQQIHATLAYPLVSVYLLEGEYLVLQAHVGYTAILERIPLVGSATGRAIRNGRAELVVDASTDPEFMIDQPGTTQGIVVPLRRNDGTIYGSLLVESTGEPVLGTPDLALMELLAEHIDIAASNAWVAEQLRAAEQTLHDERNLFTQGPVVMFRWGTQVGWPIEYVSPNSAQLGYDAATLMAGPTNYASLIVGNDYDQLLHEVRQVSRAGGDIYDNRYRIRDGSGAIRWVNDLTINIRAADGQVVHYQGYLLDITAQVEAAEQQQRLAQHLQTTHKLESLGRLAAGVAHDFNNLLNVVLGNVTMIEIEHPGAPMLAESASAIRQAARKAHALTEQILTFAGQGRLNLAPLPLNDLVLDVVRHCRMQIGDSPQIVLDLAPDLPLIDGDRVQLQQSLYNLLINASEAIGTATGQVIIQTRLFQTGNLPLRTPGPFVVVIVADDGPGMDAVQQRRAFDLFYSTKPEGRGIGLATVNGVVRQHGGLVEIISSPGAGAMVRIWLPVAAHETLADAP